MSVYTRGHGKCFRWTDTGVWIECGLDEPETRERKKDEKGNSIEGMVIGSWDGKPESLNGPLMMTVDELLDSGEN